MNTPCLHSIANFLSPDALETFQSSCDTHFDAVESSLQIFPYKRLVSLYHYTCKVAYDVCGNIENIDSDSVGEVCQHMLGRNIYHSADGVVYKMRIVFFRYNIHYRDLSTVVGLCLPDGNNTASPNSHRIFPIDNSVHVELIGPESESFDAAVEDGCLDWADEDEDEE